MPNGQQRNYGKRNKRNYRNQQPPPGYTPPPGYNQPPPGYYQQQAGYYQQPPPSGPYQQQPPPGYYSGQPPPPPPPPPQPVVVYYAQPPPNSAWSEDSWNRFDEDHRRMLYAFNDKAIRAAFIQKVFALLSGMLLVVVGIVLLFYLEEHVKKFVQENYWLLWVALGVYMVTYFAIACYESVRRCYPCNIICLVLLTLSMAYFTGVITSLYNVESVAIAAGICTVCCIAVSLFACQTRCDFTQCIGVVFVISLVLFFFGIFAIVWAILFRDKLLYIVYAGLAALLFMVYLAIDVQMIMGGRSIALSPDEYILGAVQLFVDIITIFLNILRVVGYVNEGK